MDGIGDAVASAIIALVIIAFVVGCIISVSLLYLVPFLWNHIHWI
jgi:hypothetical protein